MSTKIPNCPVETTANFLNNRWKILILRDLMNGKKRFGELKKSLESITQKVLTTNLRNMEALGLLIRTVYPEVPPRVEYELTSLGYSMHTVLDVMHDWGIEYKKTRGV